MHEDDIFGGGFGTSGISHNAGGRTGFTFDNDEMNPFGDSNALWDSAPAAGAAATAEDSASEDSQGEDPDHLHRKTAKITLSDDDEDSSIAERESGAAPHQKASIPSIAGTADGESEVALSSEEVEAKTAAATPATDKSASTGFGTQPAVQTARRVGIIRRGVKSPRVLGKQLSPASFVDPLSSAAAAESSSSNSGVADNRDPQPTGRASVDVAYSSSHHGPHSATQTRQTRSMSEARHRFSTDSGGSAHMQQSQSQTHTQAQKSASHPHPYDQQISPSQQEDQIIQAQHHIERSSTASPPSAQSSRPSVSAPSPSRTSTSRTYLGNPQRRRSLDPTPIAEMPEIMIQVTEPVKVSDSLKSYIAYKVRTRSDAPMFRESDMIVRRRYRDFDWLIQELVARHPGIVVPAIPEKQSMGRFEDEFVESRRAGLESCLRRISEHPVLWCDDVFRLFLEADDFPTKARIITENRVAAEINGTGPPLSGSSGSSGSLFGDSWGGPKYKEKDEWFSKRMQELDAIEEELKALLRAFEYSQKQRRELSIAHGELGEAYLKMAGQELSKSLSNGLTDMGSLQQKLRVLQSRQGVADFTSFQLTTDEYIRMINSVRTAFSARGRAYILWQNSLADLIKRRKVLEGFVQNPSKANPNRISQLKSEIARAEIRTESSRNAYDDVSLILKREMARFDVRRVRDFQAAIESYLVSLIETQEEIVSLWETYLESLATSDSATVTTSGT
ncbi:Vacuolar protein sorting-associated protein vps5 [Coemansia erecta]|uniref:Vacuolar protein sorting-associated protein vps5 n=1 Tax=Coemansia erecta TaxID=147472 RepID=A0A9W7Y0E1_9FUNG|nr:Vacuolar protein sorting-associated protein vps5 [Coemansia erecta]